MIKEAFIDFFRRQSLKRHSSSNQTEILPISRIKSYAAIIDVEDPTYDTCKTAIINFFRRYEINGIIFFQDFRDIGNGDRLITSIQTTITKKDLNWYGRPSDYKLKVLAKTHPDILICLLHDPAYPLEYRIRTSGARFKIGRKQLGGDVFDVVLRDPGDKTLSQLESFNAVKDFLLKIK